MAVECAAPADVPVVAECLGIPAALRVAGQPKRRDDLGGRHAL